MGTMADDLPDRDRRLGEIVFACIQSLERGAPLDLAVVQACHPEFAAELAEFFADQAQLQRMAAPLREAAHAVAPEAAADQGPTLNYGGTADHPGASIDQGPTRDRDERHL